MIFIHYLSIHAKLSIDKEKFRIVIKSAQERFSKLDDECAIVKTPDFGLTENIYHLISDSDFNFEMYESSRKLFVGL